MRSNKLLSSILASMLVLMAIVVVIPASAQAAWNDSSTMSFDPSIMFAGQTNNATYTLHVEPTAGMTSLTIMRVLIQYGWESGSHNLLDGKGDQTIKNFPDDLVLNGSVDVPSGQKLGSYNVTATIWAYINTYQDVSTNIKFEDTVTLYDPIAVQATANPTSGQAPQNVDFSVTASGGSGSYAYLWDFGDGNTSTGATVSHSYTTGGTFNPNVTVTDSVLGASTTVATTAVHIGPGMSVVISASPSAGPKPLGVTLISDVSNAADGSLTYSWDLGDGTTSTDASPTHTYAKEGEYNVVLTLTDSAQRTATSNTLTIYVSESANVDVSISATPNNGTAPLTVSFTSDVSGGTRPYTFYWDFGDGNTSTEEDPTHTYDQSGIYTVQLTVTDFTSRQTTMELTVTVKSDTTMEVLIKGTNMTGSIPLKVTFDSTILNGTGPYFYTWNFDDGTTSTQANPTHVFDKPGTYEVTLSVEDSLENVTMSNTVTIVVSNPGSASLPTWMWIWGATGVVIIAVGVVGFMMMRRKI